MALIVPQTALPGLFFYHRERSRLSKHTLHSSSFLSPKNARSTSQRHRSSKRSLQCAAVTGGSKRDVEKLAARTQHRRSRHLKGVTPTKADLLEELEEEEETEEDVENEVAQLVSEDSMSPLAENSSEDSSGSSQAGGELQIDLLAEKNALQGINAQGTEDFSGVLETSGGNAPNYSTDPGVNSGVNDAAEGAKGILETTEDTVTSVIDTATDTQKQVVMDAVEGGESLVGGVSDAINTQSTSASSDSDARTDDVRDSAKAIADVTTDTASDVGTKINETGQQVRQDMAEAASNIGDALDKQTSNAINDFKEQASEVESSVNAVADVAMDTTTYVNNKARETGEQLGQDLAEVASTGQSLLEDSTKAMSGQAKDLQSQAEKLLEEERNLLEQRAARIQNEASRSLDRVQDSVQKAAQESARAARSIGMEALGMGELLMDTAKETIQATSSIVEIKRPESGVKSKERENGSLTKDSQPQTSQQEDKGQFAGLKVLVAGASGRTGRLVVENLISKGVSVRALVRDAYKARSIQQLKDCECIEADLYKYESVKKAIGDCNVVICAIGARAFALDPFSTYQVEYEGVLNLISAAKNQGKVKKFVLISTIGVTYLQLVPLLFWKKQAELYLQRSGLDYTIVRPGGLRNTNEPEEVVMQGADSQFFGGISRKKVAEICVSALISSDASDKVVEVVSVPGSQRRSIDDLFKLV
eukprot:c9145_g1_i1 orf=57-2174(+)